MDKLITFEKSRQNVRLLYELINENHIARMAGMAEVHFIAIGGYNRTYEFLLACGARPEQIAVDDRIAFSQQFMADTHGKQILLIRRLNYTTKSRLVGDTSHKTKSLDVADRFEETLMRYENGGGRIGQGKVTTREDWIKPPIVVLDDPSLNLQFEGYRFKYADTIGFAQIKRRNANPYDLVKEIMESEPAQEMMFARYQEEPEDAETIKKALDELMAHGERELEDGYYYKPTEFKALVGSNKLANTLRKMEELNITQLSSNKRLGKENARWIIVPHETFQWEGYEYLDDDELFERELEEERLQEEAQAQEEERRLQEILSQPLAFNLTKGYVGSELDSEDGFTLQRFIDVTDTMEDSFQSIKYLEGASTDEEYEAIKAHHLLYFLDGRYEDNQRKDANYLGGKRLISIDIDDQEYTRAELEQKLDAQGLFGLIYPTPRFYYQNALRWRIILLADDEMDKPTYSNVVKGVCSMLGIHFDEASAKLSQLMGYPLANKDISIVSGSMVNVDQFRVSERVVVPFKHTITMGDGSIKTTKSILDFNHEQARMTKGVLEGNLPPVGERNETYRQIMMYLNDTITGSEFSDHHKQEAEQIKEKIRGIMINGSGLGEKEVELICRMD